MEFWRAFRELCKERGYLEEGGTEKDSGLSWLHQRFTLSQTVPVLRLQMKQLVQGLYFSMER